MYGTINLKFRNLVQMDFLIRKEFNRYVDGPVGRDRSIRNILINP